MANAGSIVIDLVANTSNFTSSVNSATKNLTLKSKMMNKSISSLNKGFNTLSRTITKSIVVAMSSMSFKSLTDAASDLQEVQNVVDTVFPNMTKQVEEFSKSASKNLGMTETQAKKMLGNFGNMSRSFGFSEKEAWNMSSTLTQAAADVASFRNLDFDIVNTKLKAVYSGETEGLKDLGIVMTQSALDSYALSHGMNETTRQMTEQEKVLLRYNFILDKLKNDLGDFSRTQNSWANQTRILKTNFEELKAALGQFLIDALTPILIHINTFIQKIKEAITYVHSLYIAIFNKKSDTKNSATSAIVSDLENTENAADKAKKAVDRVTTSFDELHKVPSTSTSSDSSSALSSDLNLSTTSKKEKNIVDNLNDSIKDFMKSSIVKNFMEMWDSLKSTFNAIKKSIKDLLKTKDWNNFKESIKDIIDEILGWIKDISDAFRKAWTTDEKGTKTLKSITIMLTSINDLISTVSRGFRNMWNDGNGEKIISDLLGLVKSFSDKTSQIAKNIKKALLSGSGHYKTDVVDKNGHKNYKYAFGNPKVGEKVSSKELTVIEYMAEQVYKLTDAFIKLADVLVNKIGEAIAEVNWGEVFEEWGEDIKWFTEQVDKLSKKIGGSDTEGLSNSLTFFLKNLLKIVVGVKLFKTLTPILKTFFSFLSKIFGANGIISTISNTAIFTNIFNSIKTGVGSALGSISTLFTETQLGMMTTMGLSEGMAGALTGGLYAIEVILGTWLVTNFKTCIIDGVSGVFNSAKELISNYSFSEIVEAFDEVFYEIGYNISSFFGPKSAEICTTIHGWFSKLGTSISKIFDSIPKKFENIKVFFTQNLPNSIKGFFTKVKTDFSNFGNKLKTDFSNLGNNLKNCLKSPLNFIISMINKLINGLNKIKITIPDFVPELGGKSWGINIPNIPALAGGGYIGPNSPVLTMIGDNKNAGEIVANDDQLEKWATSIVSGVLNGMAQIQTNNTNNQNVEITNEIYLGQEKLENLVTKTIQKTNYRKGVRK